MESMLAMGEMGSMIASLPVPQDLKHPLTVELALGQDAGQQQLDLRQGERRRFVSQAELETD